MKVVSTADSGCTLRLADERGRRVSEPGCVGIIPGGAWVPGVSAPERFVTAEAGWWVG